MQSSQPKKWNTQTWLFLGFVILLSYFTYFHNYWYPRAVFWDENYHIASAEKYLNGVFFMEPHPPLGKLLIAFGEKMFHPNVLDNQYIGTDYATNFPDNFSFAGFRFFSAFLAWWAAPLFFLLFLLIFRNAIFATLASFFYIFDNALIVHTRGAMLEGCLVFFSVLMMLLFFLIREHHNNRKYLTMLSLGFGAAFGALLTTKLLALLFILLIPAAIPFLWPERQKILKFLCLTLIGFAVVYVGVWQIHFSLARRVVPTLPDGGYYQASEEYKNILKAGTSGSIWNFPTMIRDSWKFVGHYNAGTPRLDLCKKDENGSPCYFWPFGGRTINYRWETPDGKSYRYLYLVPNPVVWWGTFAGILLGASILLSTLFTQGKKLKNGYLLFVFIALYVGFFGGVSLISRVLYLYHYFIALLIGFVIVALVLEELDFFARWKIEETQKLFTLMVLAALIFGSFQFYRPFTYYEPLTKQQFQRRNIFSLWEMQCVGCDKVSGLVVPDK